MKNNWPETVDELIEECENLIGRDLYTLGERGEPYAGEDEPRVDGTDYLAGEYQYGVMMIPAQWVTNVISPNELVTGTCKLEEIDKDCDTASEYMLNREWCFDAVYRCSCGCRFGHAAHDRPRYCPNCGANVVGE